MGKKDEISYVITRRVYSFMLSIINIFIIQSYKVYIIKRDSQIHPSSSLLVEVVMRTNLPDKLNQVR